MLEIGQHPQEPTHRSIRDPSGVGQHTFGLLDGGVCEVREVAGEGQHVSSGLVAAAPQLRSDPVRGLTGDRGRVIEDGAGRDPRGLDPVNQSGGLGDAPHQQTGVRRELDVRWHDRGVGPQPLDIDHAGLDRSGEQPGVQFLDEIDSAAGGDLHQRRRVWRRLAERDATEPQPRQRI
jgi:hypothetical protein